MALAALGIVAIPLSASAAVVSLTVTVVGPSNTPLAGVTVTADSVNGGVATATTTAKTSASGVATFPTLYVGTYTLQFPATSTTFAQYLGGTSSLEYAQLIGLDAGAGNKATLKASLSASGAISGKVVRSGGVALKNYTVQAFDASGAVARTAKTSSSGAYSITGLEPGSYRLEALDATSASPLYAAQFSGGVPSLTQATALGVQPGKTTAYSFTLSSPVKITGTVQSFDGVTHAPLAGVTVTPIRWNGIPPAFTSYDILTSLARKTNAAGAYSLSGLPAGYYTLKFTPSSDVWETDFLGDANSANESTYFKVTSGTASGKNETLVGSSSISGTVVDTNHIGTAVPDVEVFVEPTGADPFDGFHTPVTVLADHNGDYSITGLAAGTYDIYAGSKAGVTPDNMDWLISKDPFTYVVPAAGHQFANPQIAQRDPNGMVPAAGTEPTIVNGPPHVGSDLSVSIGNWFYGGLGTDSYSFQWYRGSIPIPGATDQGYTVRPGDFGYDLKAKVTVHDIGYGDRSYTSDPAPATTIGDDMVANVAPTVSGTVAVGSTLTANNGEWVAAGISPNSLDDPGIVWTYLWERSPDSVTWEPAGPGPSSGYLGKTHLITPEDFTFGPHLRVTMTGTRYGYPDAHFVVSAMTVVKGTYHVVANPKVTKSGSILKVSTGTWAPVVPPVNYDYEWTIYNDDGTSIVSSASTLNVSGQSGKRITVAVKPVMLNMVGTQFLATAQTGKAMTGTGSTAITGTAQVGAMLTAPVYTWSLGASATSPDTEKYAWQYLSGSTWKAIAGATSSTYTPTSTYAGKHLRVVETAGKTGHTSTTKTSAQTASLTAGAAPSTITPPAITGTVGGNQTVSVTPGTWSNGATSFSYQWRLSPDGVAPYVNIAGATAASYKIPSASNGKYLDVVVTAKRTGYANGTATVPGQQIASGVFVMSVAPKVSHVGNVYSVTAGTWAPTPGTVTYQWQSLDPASGNWTDEVTTPVFDASAIPNRPIQVLVSIGGVGGYANTAKSLPARSGTFTPSGPLTIGGSPAKVGSNLFAAIPASVGPSSPGLIFVWQYKSGSTWKALPNGGNIVYTVTAADIGRTIRVLVTYTSPSYTNLQQTSTTTGTVIQGDAAVAGAGPLAPKIVTAPQLGVSITVSPGNWDIGPTTFAYQWTRAGVNIPGATKATYVIPADPTWWGDDLSVKITAKVPGHADGTATVDAGNIGDGQLIATAPPKVTKTGSTLKVSNGTWNRPAPTFGYEWDVWEANGTHTAVSSTNSYTLLPSDAGKYVSVTVTTDETRFAQGSITLMAQTGAAITADISLTGVNKVGSILADNVANVSVAGSSVTYQWYRNNVAIGGANTFMYFPDVADLGKTITVKTTIARFGYTSLVSTQSAGVTISATVPASVTPPTITGVAADNTTQVGKTVGSTPGTWSIPGLSYSYQWYRDQTAIPGATASTYTTVAADGTTQLTVRVTAFKANVYSGTTAKSEAHQVRLGPFPVSTPATFLIIGTGAPTATLKTTALKFNMPVTVTYQWQWLDGAVWEDIPGAEADTLVPGTDANLVTGVHIRVGVTATRPGYFAYSNTSQELVLP